jgi:hypothetical protein
MNDDPCRDFFLQPSEALHRRYEVLRAFFVERHAQADIAKQFDLAVPTVQSLVRDFRAQVLAGQAPPFFDSHDSVAPPARPSRCSPPGPSSPMSPTVAN